MKMIAALRNQFGGHAVTSSKGATETGADSPGADVSLAGPGEPEQGQQRGAPGTL